MKMQDIEDMLDEIGIPYAYHHFTTTKAVEPPFICWLTPGSNNFAADGMVYHRGMQLDIELYTDEKDQEMEERIEAVLDQHEIYWEKSEVYIESEKMYEVLYEMEV